MNSGQQNYEKEAISQGFLQKLLEIRKQQELITTQNQNAKLENQANEYTEARSMQQLIDDPNARNNYPLSLNPDGEVTNTNENADELLQFSDENTVRFNERKVEPNEQDQNANQATHLNVINNERTYFFKQVSQPDGNPDNHHTDLTEKLLQQPIPNPQNDIVHVQTLYQNISDGNRLTANQTLLIESEVIVQPPNGIQHEITSTMNTTTEVRKEDAEKALECAHLNCTLGNWTGPVCACNHLTGKVASFRNECDLLKHNCRFDTGK